MYQEIITIIFGASPIFELRGALPLAVVQFHFPILKALTLAVIGNMLPIIPLLYFLKKFSGYLIESSPTFRRAMFWLFERFRKNQQGHFDAYRWSFLALVIFVAIPLPLTGAWSGAIASHILGLPFFKSVLAVFLGIIISGIIISIILSAGIASLQLIL